MFSFVPDRHDRRITQTGGTTTMLRGTSPVAIAMLIAAVAVGSASAQQWGDLKGRFVYDGTPPMAKPLDINKDLQCCTVKHNDESLIVGPDGGIANVVIYLRTPKVKVHPDYEADAKKTVVIDNKTCHFEPHVLCMRTSQTLDIKNSDMCSHNTNISPLGGGGINPLIAAGGNVEHKLTRQQNLPVPVNCNIHPWMSAYILPRDNPYFAVTDADGKFKIEKLPAGAELEFQVWQEKAGYVDAQGMPKGKFKKKIAAGENDLGTIKLKPALFTKKK
jgi:hypothetical protein